MRKIGGKNFWLILIISITTLIALTVGVIFLTRKSEKEFYSAGYIINSTVGKSDKYYFNDNTIYKENVFNEYVFDDVDDKEVRTSKDNFIHYLDSSISFMKNGVILDLDNINTTLVPYYNITDKSIIKYNNGSYYIENSDKTLILSNFLGRITDNKYIVVGSDVRVKLSGNDNPVSGDYFEILFIEDGIVKIENQEGSYQTISDGSVIYVGNNIKIDLGTKKVSINDDERLSLLEMTIDGNENIDIEPENGKVEENKDNSNETDDSDNDVGSNTEGNQNIPGDGESTSVIKKEVSVDLITASVGVNDLSASFQVIDTDNFIKGDLILTLTNTDTGSRVYTKTLAKVSDLQNINISSLSPGSNYLMEISEENNGVITQYFRKILKTQELDLKLVRDLVTTDSLSYRVDFGYSDVKSLNVSLYDKIDGELLGSHTVNNGEDVNVIFENLVNNTTYYVTLDSVVFNNTNYASMYTINTSDTTLKKKPILGDIYIDSDAENQKFTLKMQTPTDEDKAITKYTYEIYKAEDLSEDNISKATPVYTYTQEELKDVTLGLGDKLIEKQDYRFKVIVEYYDNYKYNDIDTGFSDYFQVVGKPKIIFTEEDVDFNHIKGTITIEDIGCLIPFEGRECNNNVNDIVIRYRSGNSTISTSINGNFIQDVDNVNSYSMNLELNNLVQNTTYIFEVYSNIDMKNGLGIEKNQYIGRFVVTTKGIESLKIQNWDSNASSYETPISVKAEMVSTVPESDYGNKLAMLTLKLYRGDGINGVVGEPLKIVKETENVKNKYYNTEFTITSNMFGINNLDELREISGGKLSKYYTIEVTDAFDEFETNEFNIIDGMYVFEIPSILLIEDEVEKPTIAVEELTNIMMKSGNYDREYDINLGDSVVVGYEVTTSFRKFKIENYFSGENPIKSINFYVESNGRNISLSESDKTIYLDENASVNVDAEGYYTRTQYFYLDYGTEYDVVDNDLRRGNAYKFSYDLSIDTDNDGSVDTNFPSGKPVSDEMISYKDDPIIQMYIDNSTENSIVYKYRILDEDNSLYKDSDGKYYLYYTVDDNDVENKSEIFKSDDYSDVILSSLNNSSIYSIDYYRASVKNKGASKISLGKYLFEGVYDALDYTLGYKLEYSNNDNRLKVVLNENEFFNRISAYLVTLDAGDDKYQTVVSKLIDCDEPRGVCSSEEKEDGIKYIIIDYADIEKLKGKNIKVSLDAFYDTGYIGFSQSSKLGNYFEDLGFVDSSNSSKVGYVFQNTNTTKMGKYVYLNEKGAIIGGSDTPKGILGFEFDSIKQKLNVFSLLNIAKNKFVPYEEISNNISVSITSNGVTEKNNSSIKNNFNPKVLDKISIPTENNNFKFTSIIPKVDSKAYPLINGAEFDIKLSISEEILESDFVKDKNGEYNFYVEIYEKIGEDWVYLKKERITYSQLKNNELNNIVNDVQILGLTPDTSYVYYISADMNKNGQNVRTKLFDFNYDGYVYHSPHFSTLNKDDVLKNVSYNYKSFSDVENNIYTKRELYINTELLTNRNFDVRYEIRDDVDNLVYESTVSNDNIFAGKDGYNVDFIQDISGNEFIFGTIDYYTLKIYAVTETDSGIKELNIYDERMNSEFGKNIGNLENAKFEISQEAYMDYIDNEFNHSIKYNIKLTDEDRVITDGIYYVELQDASYKNACGDNPEACRATINILKGTCTIAGGNFCEINTQNQGFQGVNIKFNNLKSDTNYIIYAYANTYRNNISLVQKESLVYARKSQYTKSDLGFSLGAVTPTAVSKNKLVITFVGASNIENKLKEITYNITEIGAEKIQEGTLFIGSNVYFGKDKDGYPTLSIDINPGKQLGLNNYIIISYKYLDDNGKLATLMFGDDTNIQYSVKNEK